MGLDGRRPDDIRRKWFDVVRRMQSTTSNVTTVSILQVNIVVDKNGDPLVWTEPRLTKLEPRSARQAVVDLLRQLTETGSVP